MKVEEVGERTNLLAPEGLVVVHRRRLDQVLQVRPGEEVSEVDKLAVPLVLDVDDPVPVLSAADGLAIDDHVCLRADDGKGNHFLFGRKVQREIVGVSQMRRREEGQRTRLTRMRALRACSSSSCSSVSIG